MRALVVFALASLAGCYSPSYRDCQLSCAQSGTCPSGFSCIGDVCRAGGNTGPCEGGDGGGSDDAGRPLTLETLDDYQLSQLCSLFIRCGMVEDLTTCEELYGAGPGGIMPTEGATVAQLVAAESAGRLVFHGDKAEECYTALANSTCTRDVVLSQRGAVEACLSIFEGTVPMGGVCAFGAECVSQDCDTSSCTPDANSCCLGVCRGGVAPAVKVTLSTCRPGIDQCEAGSYCGGNDPTNTMCLPYKTMGQGCTGSQECADQFYCGDSAGTKVCVPLVQTLGTCMTSDQCLNTVDICGNGKCQAGGLAGASCDAAFGANSCQLQHACESGTCVLPPAAGDSCTTFPFCRGDAYCSAMQCVTRLADGEICAGANGSYTCSSGYCNPTTQVCAPKPTCI